MEIKTVVMNHNGVCFHTGEKVGRPHAVALLIDNGVVKTAMPVGEDYARYVKSGSKDSFEDWSIVDEKVRQERSKKARARLANK